MSLLRRSFCRGLATGLLFSPGCDAVAWTQDRVRQRLLRSGARSQTLSLGVDDVHVWTAGAGPAVLLLHGFGGNTALQWEHPLRTWGAHFRVVAPDLLWFGASHSQDADPSLEHQAKAILAMLDALDVRSIQVVGLSYGGMVTEEILRLRPGIVRSRVTVDSPASDWSVEDHRAMLRRLGARRAAEIFVPSTPEGVRRLLSLAYWRPPRIPRSTAESVISAMYDPHRRQLTALLDYLEEHLETLIRRDASRDIPSLVVWGEGDQVFPVEVGRRLSERQNARFETIPRTRHLPVAEAPKAFDAIVVPHLSAYV